MISTGGPRNSAPGTVNQLFFKACERRKPDALQVKRDGRYQPISHDMLKDRVRRASLGLDALGVRPGDRVAILSTNRPEWVVADLACLTMGVADVPVYPNLPAEQTAYVLRDSGAVAIFTSDAAQTAKVASIRGECPALAPRHHVRRIRRRRHDPRRPGIARRGRRDRRDALVVSRARERGASG